MINFEKRESDRSSGYPPQRQYSQIPPPGNDYAAYQRQQFGYPQNYPNYNQSPPPEKPERKGVPFGLALVFLVLGIAIGYFLDKLKEQAKKLKPTGKATPSAKEVVKPAPSDEGRTLSILEQHNAFKADGFRDSPDTEEHLLSSHELTNLDIDEEEYPDDDEEEEVVD